jgi:hypothetical protein
VPSGARYTRCFLRIGSYSVRAWLSNREFPRTVPARSLHRPFFLAYDRLWRVRTSASPSGHKAQDGKTFQKPIRQAGSLPVPRVMLRTIRLSAKSLWYENVVEHQGVRPHPSISDISEFESSHPSHGVAGLGSLCDSISHWKSHGSAYATFTAATSRRLRSPHQSLEISTWIVSFAQTRP